jgi:hypothetical protein
VTQRHLLSLKSNLALIVLEFPLVKSTYLQGQVGPGRRFHRLNLLRQIVLHFRSIVLAHDQVVAADEELFVVYESFQSTQGTDDYIERFLARAISRPHHDLHQNSNIVRILRRIDIQIYVWAMKSTDNATYHGFKLAGTARWIE